MRPQTLRLIGFRSYADETIDFRHHTLVVISGDTGAGKTSILDAVAFALFGRTSELGSSRELLTLGATHGEVALTFSAGDGTWRVTRRFGHDAPEPGHLLEQLEGDEVLDRVVGAAAVNAAVAALIGMTFQSFTSAVLLAQGRFSQFLQATPKERDAILRELFGIVGLDAVRSVAIATRDAHHATADALDDERTRLGLVTHRDRLTQARGVRLANATLATLTALRPLVTEYDLVERHAASADRRAGEIHGVLTQVGSTEEHATAITEQAELRRRLEDLRVRTHDAHVALERAEARRDQMRSDHGGTASELSALRTHAERAASSRQKLPEEQAEHRAHLADLDARSQVLDQTRARMGVLTTARASREAIVEALARVLATRDVVQKTTQTLVDARRTRDEARADATHVTQELAAIEAAMGELRHAHLTAQLRHQIEPGKPCPVCGQTVFTPPPQTDAGIGDVEERVAGLRARADALAAAASRSDANVRAAELHDATARTAAADAVARLRAAGGASSDDQATLGGLQAELQAMEQEYSTLAPQVEQLAAAVERDRGTLGEVTRRLERDAAEVAALEGRLGAWADVEDPVAALSAAMRELELADQAVLTATQSSRHSMERLARAEDELRQFEQTRLSGLRQALTVLATRLEADLPAPGLDAAQLVVAAGRLVNEGLAKYEEAERTRDESRSRARVLGDEIAAAGAQVGVATGADLTSRLRSAAAAARSAQQTFAETEHRARQARRLQIRADDERRAGDLFGQVAIDLQANRFPRFLLSRFHERLALGATARLLSLSHGAFSFTGQEPDHLAVVDHRRAHGVRSAATLSGGERFLASLALALALADIAAGAEGRLECLFLDEGFSSLDADSLELAISGVEQMADDGRLVVIITHLPGVAERLGAVIHVRKDPAGTSRVIDVTARRRAGE